MTVRYTRDYQSRIFVFHILEKWCPFFCVCWPHSFIQLSPRTADRAVLLTRLASAGRNSCVFFRERNIAGTACFLWAMCWEAWGRGLRYDYVPTRTKFPSCLAILGGLAWPDCRDLKASFAAGCDERETTLLPHAPKRSGVLQMELRGGSRLRWEAARECIA